jgi:hypothetical protein
VSTEGGLLYQIAPCLRFGVAGPLVQSKLRYASAKENLPRVYRAGISWTFDLPLASGGLPLQVLFDTPYYANEDQLSVALGVETHVGPLALRLGSSTRSNIQNFSMGAGFQFQRKSLDYAFGLASNSAFDSVHKINFSYRFGKSEAAELAPASGSQAAAPKS